VKCGVQFYRFAVNVSDNLKKGTTRKAVFNAILSFLEYNFAYSDEFMESISHSVNFRRVSKIAKSCC